MNLPDHNVQQLAESEQNRYLQEIRAVRKQPPPLTTVELGEFLLMDIPPTELIVDPFLPVGGIVMIHAKTGVGKTHLALNIAYSVACGSDFLNWKCPEPRGVLYVDGEMAQADLKERFVQIAGDIPPVAPFKICNLEQQIERAMPDISTVVGQTEIDELITDDIDLVVLDNLSTLSYGGRENEAESWNSVQQWLLSLRAKGKTTLIVHHSGKSGSQRGTSKREAILNTTICLKRPQDYDPETGASFEIHFQKGRGVYGKDAKPIEARMESDSDGRSIWTWKHLEESTHAKVVALFLEGLSQKEISMELEINKSSVSRHLKRARDEGVIKK